MNVSSTATIKLGLQGISKRFGNTTILNNLSLNVEEGEFLVLVGPSGCGKSTVLRLIAGLETPDSGEIFLEGETLNQTPPKDRNIAMVFQNYALYPHMSVYDNMAFALKMRKLPKHEIAQQIALAAKRLQLEALLKRKPKELSGGQRQRVALGRAIVRNPKLFLMDEPLSNLDAKLRQHMRHELATLHQSLNATTLYVTHDQTEALTLGHRLAVLNNGKLQQLAAPQTIYEQPANRFVASFMGQMNLLSVVLNHATNTLELEAPPHSKEPVECLASLASLNLDLPQHLTHCTVGFRPEHVQVANDSNTPVFTEPGLHLLLQTQRFERLGAEKLFYAQFPSVLNHNTEGAVPLLARTPNHFEAQPGEPLHAFVPAKHLHWFSAEEAGTRL